MGLKPFVVAIFLSVIAFKVEAQEHGANREVVAKPIDKTLAVVGEPQDGATLSLSELIAQALENNPEIRAGKKKDESARARAGQATYLEDPELNWEAWGVPLNQPVNYRKANPLVFGMRQKLPFFGKLGLKGEIAAQEVKMVEEELRAKEQEIIAKVKSSYADYFMASKAVEIYKELLELVRYTSTTAEGLSRVGKAPQQDVIKALDHDDRCIHHGADSLFSPLKRRRKGSLVRSLLPKPLRCSSPLFCQLLWLRF
jgi:outer membrane protein, heavy metal efflux system